jgi:hypothetical protein
MHTMARKDLASQLDELAEKIDKEINVEEQFFHKGTSDAGYIVPIVKYLGVTRRITNNARLHLLGLLRKVQSELREIRDILRSGRDPVPEEELHAEVEAALPQFKAGEEIDITGGVPSEEHVRELRDGN